MALAATVAFYYLPLLLLLALPSACSSLRFLLPPRCGGDFTAPHAPATFGPAASASTSAKELPLLAALFCGAAPLLCAPTSLSRGCAASGLPSAHGRVLVVARGGCAYTTKAVAAQEVGAVGLVVVEGEKGRRASRMLGWEETVRIPVVMVGWGDWERVAGCVGEGRVAFEGRVEGRGVGSVVVRAVVLWVVCRGVVAVLRWGRRGEHCQSGRRF